MEGGGEGAGEEGNSCGKVRDRDIFLLFLYMNMLHDTDLYKLS